MLATGAAGGMLASQTLLPLPYMLGSLIATALLSAFLGRRFPTGYKFPQNIRLIFLAVIGVMIGAQVSPELGALLPAMAVSFAALTLFVALAHAGNYAIFHHIGGYDKPTAFYSGTPGGLMESIAMGEEAGADIAILTMQQFLRIILVISLLPIGLSVWLGAPVGSAGGMTLARADVDLSQLPVVVAVGALGLAVGRWLRLPAGQLTGPLFVAGAVSLSGLVPLDMPQWLINDAQIVIGAGLGMRFGGLKGRALLRGLGLGLASVGFMMTLAVPLVLLVQRITGAAFDTLLVSFAPGGVTEMALIALSLQANPALVTAHHIYRIILTVIGMSVIARLQKRGNQL
ncbi:AbrB family transcriptional regulator [Seohaeicola saemankumensis]|uniref:AbrB family transcriptional regulator n=1 Tax=Seohaeicola saemankumensis TaxID=481181 RepID=UPI001E5C2810|nr:AbrB family transcriptional regulator [Seohaeicola saemankumensis]